MAINPSLSTPQRPYRGRLAPSPTGYLHLGHARTFWTAQARARAAGGELILRNDDLDRSRCRPEFVTAMLEDLRWFGLAWSEGPDVGGRCAPYDQSARLFQYAAAFERLREIGAIYPCSCSRREVLRALTAPHEGDEEPVYPGTCRGRSALIAEAQTPALQNWRFRVPDGVGVEFEDRYFGPQRTVAGVDFGDFLVWRKDGLPSYQLACVVDDAQMEITEVVRGADLITSTFRQLLLLRALGLEAPAFYHCPLILDKHGTRLAKRHDALSLRTLRAAGKEPGELRSEDCWERPAE